MNQSELLEELFERCHFGIYIVDSEFRIRSMNRHAQEGAFANVRPVIGRPLADVMRILWPEEVAEEIIRVFRHTLDTGEPFFSRDFVRRRADKGEVEGYEWELHRVTLPEGDGKGVACFYFDSSRLRHTEDALRRSETRLTETLESISDGFMAVDGQWRITYVNAAAERAIGMTRREMLGRTWQELFPPAVGSHLEHELRRCMEEKVPVEVENFYPPWQRWFQCRAYPTPDGGHAQYFQDITERKRAEQALRDSEQRFRALVTASSEAIYRMSPDWSEMRHLSGHEYIADTLEPSRGWLDKYIHPDDQGQVMARIDQAIQSRSMFEYEHRVIRTDGTLGWVSSRAIPILDESGAIVEWFGAARDVTERKQMELTLRQSREDLDRAQALAHVGSWHLDVSRNELRWSDESYRIAGIPKDQPLTYESFLAIVHPDDRDYVDRKWQAALRGEPYDIEHRMVVAGETRWAREQAHLEFDARGEVVGGYGAFHDITERKRAEEALRDANRRKDVFLATLAHELRNPLAPLVNSLDLLDREGSGSAQLIKIRGMMRRQLNHLTRLVDDLLDVSRISRDKVELRKQRVELRDVVDSALEACGYLAQNFKHEITIDLPVEPIWIVADPVRLAQVFSNLLNNASKYTPERGHVYFSARREGKDVVVCVRDTGIGIPPDKLAEVFTMFSQVSQGVEREKGGLGIGLHLVKRLVELHGGSVAARSGGLGKGAEFVVRLPAVCETPGPAMLEPEPRNEETRGVCRRILIADDNADAAQMLAMLLRAGGHDTRVARDGLEAVELAREYGPDVVLLDIGMPGMNGYEACREIRRASARVPPLMVAVSGWGQEGDRRASAEAGFDKHLVKPVVYADLMNLLRFESPVSGIGQANAEVNGDV